MTGVQTPRWQITSDAPRKQAASRKQPQNLRLDMGTPPVFIHAMLVPAMNRF